MAFGDESNCSSMGIAHAFTGITVCISSASPRRTRIRIGRSPLSRTNFPIQLVVLERGTASLLNVRRWSPVLIPAAAAGEVSATDRTVASVQLTETAS
jgi:hypothetical protein